MSANGIPIPSLVLALIVLLIRESRLTCVRLSALSIRSLQNLSKRFNVTFCGGVGNGQMKTINYSPVVTRLTIWIQGRRISQKILHYVLVLITAIFQQSSRQKLTNART